jgi:hypothetical protein
VFGRKGAWIGAGAVDLQIADKQYIGIVSQIDIVAFLFRNNDGVLLRERLSTPIAQVVGQTDELVSLSCFSLLHNVQFVNFPEKLIFYNS